MPDRRARSVTHRLASFALGVLIVCGGPLHAESWLLRGTIGASPVVMGLDGNDGSLFGSYFYEKYRQDIPLRGDADANGVRLESGTYGEDADRFALLRDGDGFKGSFVHGKSKPLPVELHVVAPGSVPDPLPGIAFESPLPDYERLRLAGLRFVPGKEEALEGGFRIRWATEPLSGISMFHVVAGYPDAAMAAINRIIDRDAYSSLMQHFGCANGDGGSGDEWTEVTSHYLTARLVSYAVSSSWSCYGAAHPDFGVNGTTIDAANGRELSLEDVYWLGSGDKPKPESDAWYDYRRDVFAPAVVELFQRLYPGRVSAHDESGEGEGASEGKDTDQDPDVCDYSDPSVWDFADWYLTDAGLHLGAYFARVARVCDDPDWADIPYAILAKNNPALFGQQ
jgi:hypothetical protein